MKLLLFVVSVTAFMFCSCLNKKYLAKNQVVFKVEPEGNTRSKIIALNTGDKRIEVKAEEVNGVLLIQKADEEANDFILPTIVASGFDTARKYQQLMATGKYYFPETFYPHKGDPNSNSVFVTPEKLKFSENHLVFQLQTTPLKVRPGIVNRRFKDSLPLQALAELNLGAAFGVKRTWTSFRAHATEDGVNVVNTSFACTGFFSLGGTNVKPLTTRYSIPYDKSEYALSYGVNFLFGYYNLNLGFSIGADHLLNRSIGEKWIFDGKPWYGITVAYDICK
jgi:hypothetical protein